MIITRRKVRIKVFQAVFSWSFTGNEAKAVFDYHLGETHAQLKQQQKPIAIEDDAKFMWDLFFTALKKRDEYLNIVAGQLENWDLERVARADQVLILLALVEILHFECVPVKVTINEYIEIAKEFSTEKSGTFINGVLDSLQQKLTEQGRVNKSGRGVLKAEP